MSSSHKTPKVMFHKYLQFISENIDARLCFSMFEWKDFKHAIATLCTSVALQYNNNPIMTSYHGSNKGMQNPSSLFQWLSFQFHSLQNIVYKIMSISHNPSKMRLRSLWSTWDMVRCETNLVSIHAFGSGVEEGDRASPPHLNTGKMGIWANGECTGCYLEFCGRSFLNRPPTAMSTLMTMMSPSITNTLPTMKPHASNISLQKQFY